MSRRFLNILVGLLACGLLDCGGGGSSSSSSSAPINPIAALELSPATATLAIGQFQSFSVVATDASGNRLTDRIFTWSSSNSSVAAVAANGLAQGIAAGQVTISVSSEGKSAAALLNVVANPVVTPPPNGSPFASGAAYAAGPTPQAAAAADFDGDGKRDLVTANFDGNSLSLLKGNGDGTFAQPPIFLPAGRSPVSLSAGDFNRDGKKDLAVGNLDGQNIMILLGNGDGTFQAALLPSFSGQPVSLLAVDLNGDNVDDLAVVDIGKNQLLTFQSNGDGTFAAPITYATGNGPSFVGRADLNADGRADLIVANGGDGTISVFLNNPASPGGLLAAAAYPVGAQPVSIAVGDLNGDGKPELIVANKGSDTLSLLSNNGSGQFSPATSFSLPQGSAPQSVVTADFDGDGFLDLAVARAGGIVTLYPGNGDGTFKIGIDHTVGARPIYLLTGFFNAGSKPDLVVINSGDNTFSALVTP